MTSKRQEDTTKDPPSSKTVGKTGQDENKNEKSSNSTKLIEELRLKRLLRRSQQSETARDLNIVPDEKQQTSPG